MQKLTSLGMLGLTALMAASASAQATVEIDSSADYEQSLKCYRYYDVADQVATAFAGNAEADGADAAKFKRQSTAAKVLKMVWNAQIDATKERRSDKKVDADLEKFGAPVIADANAGLAGDAEATKRYEAVQAECKPFETAAE